MESKLDYAEQFIKTQITENQPNLSQLYLSTLNNKINLLSEFNYCNKIKQISLTQDKDLINIMLDEAEKNNTDTRSMAITLFAYNKLIHLNPQNTRLINKRTALINRLKEIKIVDTWRHLGTTYFGLNNYDEAIKNYQQVLAEQPKYKEVWIELGNVFAAKKQFNEALHAYQQALAIDDDFAQAKKNIRLLISSGAPIDFYKMLLDAIILDLPTNVTLALAPGEKNLAKKIDKSGKNAAHLAAKLGQVDCLEALLKHDPSLVETVDKYKQTPLHYAAYHGRTTCVKLLIQYLKDTTQLDSPCFKGQTPLHNAVMSYRSSLNGKAEDAIDCMYQLLKNGADLFRLNLDNKTILQMAKEGTHWTLVVNYLRQILPQAKQAIIEQYDALCNQNKFAEAIKECDRIVALYPNDAIIWNNKAYMYTQLGMFEDACECAKKSINLNGECAYSWRNLGNAQFGLKQYKEALRSYRNALLLNANFSEVEEEKNICLKKISDISLIKLICSKIEAHRLKHIQNREDVTFFGHTFIYNKNYSFEKLNQTEGLIKELKKTDDEKEAFLLIKKYLKLDENLAFRYKKDLATFSQLLNNIIEHWEELKSATTQSEKIVLTYGW